jgi:hypothetical protein
MVLSIKRWGGDLTARITGKNILGVSRFQSPQVGGGSVSPGLQFP